MLTASINIIVQCIVCVCAWYIPPLCNWLVVNLLSLHPSSFNVKPAMLFYFLLLVSVWIPHLYMSDSHFHTQQHLDYIYYCPAYEQWRHQVLQHGYSLSWGFCTLVTFIWLICLLAKLFSLGVDLRGQSQVCHVCYLMLVNPQPFWSVDNLPCPTPYFAVPTILNAIHDLSLGCITSYVTVLSTTWHICCSIDCLDLLG